jgi:7-carboxy-7-deazaguanine synthase
MSSPVIKKVPKWPVVEIFGPTIQGEGVDQGVVSHFVRFGGCDYRCDWCDTPHAVLPEEVRANAVKMDQWDICHELEQLGGPQQAPWIILTGGNPALHDLRLLVDELHENGYLVAVETQGSRWREWMADLDRVCVSPKGPSSKEPKARENQLGRFLEEGLRARALGEKPYEWLFLKVVIFNDADLDYAESVRSQLSDSLLYLSAGNDAGRTVGNPTRKDKRTTAGIRRDLLARSKWLVEEVFKRPALCAQDVIVQSQYHVLLWGNELGR